MSKVGSPVEQSSGSDKGKLGLLPILASVAAFVGFFFFRP